MLTWNPTEALAKITAGEYAKDVARQLGVSRQALSQYFQRNAPHPYRQALIQGFKHRLAVDVTRDQWRWQFCLARLYLPDAMRHVLTKRNELKALGLWKR